MQRLLLPIISLIVILTGVVIFGSLAGVSNKPQTPQEILKPFTVSEVVPSITVKDKDSKDVVIDEKTVSPTLVTFWDANCSECKVALPLLVSYNATHPQLKTIYINVKNDPELVATTLKELNISLDTLYDDGTAFAKWFGTMPSTYFIKDSHIQLFFPGRVSQEHLDALSTLL